MKKLFLNVFSLLFIAISSVVFMACDDDTNSNTFTNNQITLSYNTIQPSISNVNVFYAYYKDGHSSIQKGGNTEFIVDVPAGYDITNLQVEKNDNIINPDKFYIKTTNQITFLNEYTLVNSYSNEDSLSERRIVYEINNVQENTNIEVDATNCSLVKIKIANQLDSSADFKIYTINTQLNNINNTSNFIATKNLLNNNNYFSEISVRENNYYYIDYGKNAYITVKTDSVSNSGEVLFNNTNISFGNNKSDITGFLLNSYEIDKKLVNTIKKVENNIESPEYFAIIYDDSEQPYNIDWLLPSNINGMVDIENKGMYNTSAYYSFYKYSKAAFMFVGQDKTNPKFPERQITDAVDKTSEIVLRLQPKFLMSNQNENIVKNIYEDCITLKLGETTIALTSENSTYDGQNIYVWFKYSDIQTMLFNKEFSTYNNEKINCPCGYKVLKATLDETQLENTFSIKVLGDNYTRIELEGNIQPVKKENNTYLFCFNEQTNSVDVNVYYDILQELNYTSDLSIVQKDNNDAIKKTLISFTNENEILDLKNFLYYNVSTFEDVENETSCNNYSEISSLISKLNFNILDEYAVKYNNTQNYYKITNNTSNTNLIYYIASTTSLFGKYLYIKDINNDYQSFWYSFTDDGIEKTQYKGLKNSNECLYTTRSIKASTTLSEGDYLVVTQHFTEKEKYSKKLDFSDIFEKEQNAKFYILKSVDEIGTISLENMTLESEQNIWIEVNAQNYNDIEIYSKSGETIYFYSNISDNIISGNQISSTHFMNLYTGPKEYVNKKINGNYSSINIEKNTPESIYTCFGEISFEYNNAIYKLYSITLDYSDKFAVNNNNPLSPAETDIYTYIILDK